MASINKIKRNAHIDFLLYICYYNKWINYGGFPPLNHEHFEESIGCRHLSRHCRRPLLILGPHSRNGVVPIQESLRESHAAREGGSQRLPAGG